MSIYRIFNQGEIGSLADGWRSVIALAPGRKWILCRYRHKIQNAERRIMPHGLDNWLVKAPRPCRSSA
jgi:hypothetical protein